MEDEKNTTSATADVAENAAEAEHIDVSAQGGAQNGTATEAVTQSEPQAEQKAEPSGNSDAEK